MGVLGIAGTQVVSHLTTSGSEVSTIEHLLTGSHGIVQIEQGFGGQVTQDPNFTLSQNGTTVEITGTHPGDQIVIEAMSSDGTNSELGNGLSDANGELIVTGPTQAGEFIVQAADTTTGELSNSITEDR
jgi:hypothetical protein